MSTRRKPNASHSAPNNLFPDKDAEIEKDITDLIDDPATWLDTPHARFAGAKPKDLIGTDREQMLRDLLRSIKYGIPT